MAPEVQTAPAVASASSPHPLARLLHRWFVEYNPLYLASALLVVIGLRRISRALAFDLSLFGQLAVGLASEAYALSLIGAAAILTRLGLRRPATFVALLAIVYQGDLALGTETYALLGGVGVLASAAWLGLFAAKLLLLAKALRLRLSRSAFSVPVLGAVGLAAIPHLSRTLSPHALTTVVALWLFATPAAALWTTREVRETTPLDAWAQTVKRRALLATWGIWASLGLAHASCWLASYHLSPWVLPVALAALATRAVRTELGVVVWLGSLLGVVATWAPELLSASSAMAATLLALHALRHPVEPSAAPSEPGADYRGAVEPASLELPPFAPLEAAARARMLAFAGYALYLSAWSAIVPPAAFPDHVALLDAVVALPMAWVAVRRRSFVIPTPLVAIAMHAAWRTRLVEPPKTSLQWGVAMFVSGLALLVAGTVVSWRWRVPEPEVEAR